MEQRKAICNYPHGDYIAIRKPPRKAGRGHCICEDTCYAHSSLRMAIDTRDRTIRHGMVPYNSAYMWTIVFRKLPCKFRGSLYQRCDSSNIDSDSHGHMGEGCHKA
jgi:hypothetical protein